MSSENNWSKKGTVIGKIFLLCLLAIAVVLGIYRPFRLPLDPELVAEVRLDPNSFPTGKYNPPWHAVYEAYDGYPGTWVHDYEVCLTRSLDPWPEMDLENYTYIYTYGQRIESLSYYIWRENNSPTYTGAKTGHLVYSEEVEPLMVFVYRIPKMRINHPDL